MIAAFNPVFGCVAHWIFAGNCNQWNYGFFLQYFLLPALARFAAGQQFYVTCDNLPAHLTQVNQQLIIQAGHVLVRRPVASPDLAFCEEVCGLIRWEENPSILGNLQYMMKQT